MEKITREKVCNELAEEIKINGQLILTSICGNKRRKKLY